MFKMILVGMLSIFALVSVPAQAQGYVRDYNPDQVEFEKKVALAQAKYNRELALSNHAPPREQERRINNAGVDLERRINNAQLDYERRMIYDRPVYRDEYCYDREVYYDPRCQRGGPQTNIGIVATNGGFGLAIGVRDRGFQFGTVIGFGGNRDRGYRGHGGHGYRR
jgi:hypothetical protein